MADESVAARDEDTFPKLLLRNARIRGARPAMREKDFGIWQSWTWADTLGEVRAFALGLSGLGLARGDAVAVVGANRPQLYWTFCAVQSLGAVPVPVYADAVADEMAFVLDHAGVRFAVVEDQEQVDKLLSIRERLPKLERIYDYFPRLKERRDAQAGYTSGGEQQMTAIGRALMARPRMMLLDGDAATLRANEDVKEFYLGVSTGERRSFRDFKSYRRRKRWLT